MRDAPFTAVAFGFQREEPMVALRSCELGQTGYTILAVNQSMEFCEFEGRFWWVVSRMMASIFAAASIQVYVSG
jgi:hypothetical protein